jgi:hypothetical protein
VCLQQKRCNCNEVSATENIYTDIIFTVLTDISNPVGNQDRYNNLHCVYIAQFSWTSPHIAFPAYSDCFMPAHCRSKCLMLHPITLSDSHTHSVVRLWTKDRLVAERLIVSATYFKFCPRKSHHCPVHRDFKPQTHVVYEVVINAEEEHAASIFKVAVYPETASSFHSLLNRISPIIKLSGIGFQFQ